MSFIVFTGPWVSHQNKNIRLQAPAKQDKYSSVKQSQHLVSAFCHIASTGYLASPTHTDESQLLSGTVCCVCTSPV